MYNKTVLAQGPVGALDVTFTVSETTPQRQPTVYGLKKKIIQAKVLPLIL